MGHLTPYLRQTTHVTSNVSVCDASECHSGRTLPMYVCEHFVVSLVNHRLKPNYLAFPNFVVSFHVSFLIFLKYNPILSLNVKCSCENRLATNSTVRSYIKSCTYICGCSIKLALGTYKTLTVIVVGIFRMSVLKRHSSLFTISNVIAKEHIAQKLV